MAFSLTPKSTSLNISEESLKTQESERLVGDWNEKIQIFGLYLLATSSLLVFGLLVLVYWFWSNFGLVWLVYCWVSSSFVFSQALLKRGKRLKTNLFVRGKSVPKVPFEDGLAQKERT